jgi:hypothetical protein
VKRSDLHTAAAGLSYLRGLFLLPLGAVLVAGALGNWNAGPFRHDWAFVLALGIAGLVCLPIARFYREHYGRMTPSSRQQAREAVALGVAIVVTIAGASLLRSDAGWSLDLPVNAVAVVFAVVMLVSYATGPGVRPHHVTIWGALLVVGAIPVWGGADPSNVGMVLAGVAVMASGALDHRLLIRTFGAP